MSTRWVTWSRPICSCVGLLLAYFAFPVDWRAPGLGVATSLVLTTVGLAVLGWVMVVELQHLRSGAEGLTTPVLALMLELLIISSSLTFYLVEVLAPEQFAGLRTRTDALYFTLSTMTTVGYGDVHAQGQLARGLVCGLIVFDIVVVASLVRPHTRL